MGGGWAEKELERALQKRGREGGRGRGREGGREGGCMSVRLYETEVEEERGDGIGVS